MAIAQGAHDEAIMTARQSLEATRDAVMATADEFAKKQEASKAEHERVIEGLATRQQQTENSLAQANTSFSAMEEDISLKQDPFGNIVSELGNFSAQKDQMIADLDVKQKTMEALNETIQKTFFELAGGWKVSHENEMIRSDKDTVKTQQELTRQFSEANARMQNIEAYVRGLGSST